MSKKSRKNRKRSPHQLQCRRASNIVKILRKRKAAEELREEELLRDDVKLYALRMKSY